MNDKKLRTLLVCGACPGQPEAAELVSACKSLGRDGVYGAAKKGKILPFAAKTLTELGLDTDFWNGVLSQYRQRNCAIVSLLDRAYEALEQTGVKKMFVSENFGALLSAGEDLALAGGSRSVLPESGRSLPSFSRRMTLCRRTFISAWIFTRWRG